MALQNKCELFLNNNEIVIYDSTEFYSSTNSTGWSHPSMVAPSTASVIDSSLTGNIESITLNIDGTIITIEDGTNEALLPVDFSYLASPKDLVFTINKYTYSSFYTAFSGFKDGLHDVTYSIEFTTASGYDPVSYTTKFFTYKEVEAKVWERFHNIAYNHNSGGVDKKFVQQALYAYSLYKGLEYAARTSTNMDKALEILATLEYVVDFNNSLSL